MRYNGEVNGVRRFLARDMGIDVKGKVATNKCGNWLCVNPAHILVVSRAALQKRIAKTVNYNTNPLRQKKISDLKRQQSRLNMEIVEQIRQANDTQRNLAKTYGVTQATISCIKTGRTWRDYSNPFAALVGALTK